VLDSSARAQLDAVPRNGGTLILAGDSIGWALFARSLGLTVEPIRPGATVATNGEITIPFAARYSLRGEGTTPLLWTPGHETVAVRMPYRQGSAIVIGSAEPFTNNGLRDEQTARFVYREILAPNVGRSLAFDETHHSFAPVPAGPTTVDDLLARTAAGRAAIYAAVLTFLFLLLNGRRLGPAIVPRPPTETRRTMYEHVQMLANLYRRARQLTVARAAFSRHYARLLARGTSSPGQTASLAEAVAHIDAARTERELIAAVSAAHEGVRP
jgi:hypothetical protein